MRSSTWQQRFNQCYYDHSGSLPLIVPGQDPLQDITTVASIGPGRTYWFTYRFERYTPEYWAMLQVMYASHDDYIINVAPSLTLSEAVMGIDAIIDLDIPDLWIMTVEILDQGQSRPRLL